MSVIGRHWLDSDTVAVFHDDGSMVIETPCGDIEVDNEAVVILRAAIDYHKARA